MQRIQRCHGSARSGLPAQATACTQQQRLAFWRAACWGRMHSYRARALKCVRLHRCHTRVDVLVRLQMLHNSMHASLWSRPACLHVHIGHHTIDNHAHAYTHNTTQHNTTQYNTHTSRHTYQEQGLTHSHCPHMPEHVHPHPCAPQTLIHTHQLRPRCGVTNTCTSSRQAPSTRDEDEHAPLPPAPRSMPGLPPGTHSGLLPAPPPLVSFREAGASSPAAEAARMWGASALMARQQWRTTHASCARVRVRAHIVSRWVQINPLHLCVQQRGTHVLKLATCTQRSVTPTAPVACSSMAA